MTDAAVKLFIEQGILGAICILLMAVLVYLWRALQKSHNDRINDLKTYAEKVKAGNEALSGLVLETQKSAQHLASEAATNQQRVIGDIENLREDVQEVRTSVERVENRVIEVKEQQVRLEVAVTSGGRHG